MAKGSDSFFFSVIESVGGAQQRQMGSFLCQNFSLNKENTQGLKKSSRGTLCNMADQYKLHHRKKTKHNVPEQGSSEGEMGE